MKEQDWDKLLKVKTGGRDDSHANHYNYPYEPTPYAVLERFANEGYVGKKDTLLDYGCGKGRVSFFMAYESRAKCIGVEFDERIYQSALDNSQTAVSASRVSFVHAKAECFEVPENVTACFFFNPFSLEVLRRVLARVIESYYNNPRELRLFFYYPSDEYIAYLMQVVELEFEDEIDCSDIADGEKMRECIVIFRMNG